MLPYSDGWYRRSVPTVGNSTLTPHTRGMVSQNVPSGSDLHPCANVPFTQIMVSPERPNCVTTAHLRNLPSM